MNRNQATCAIVIGRNEGERLVRCLMSLIDRVELIIYVDSRSSDSSRDKARKLEVHVVELDQKQPFTAARARNIGVNHLAEIAPEIELIQFVDGDCEIADCWLETASAEIEISFIQHITT